MNSLSKRYPRYSSEIEALRKEGVAEDVIQEVISHRVEDAKVQGFSDEEIQGALTSSPKVEAPKPKEEEGAFEHFLPKKVFGSKEQLALERKTSEFERTTGRKPTLTDVKDLALDLTKSLGRGLSHNYINPKTSGKFPKQEALGRFTGQTAPAGGAFGIAKLATKVPLAREALAGALFGATEKPEEGGSRIVSTIENAVAWPVLGAALRVPGAALKGMETKSMKLALRELFGVGKVGGVADMPKVRQEVKQEQLALPAPETMYVTPEGTAIPYADYAGTLKRTPREALMPSTPTAQLAYDVKQGGGEFLNIITTKEGPQVFFMDPKTNRIHRMPRENATTEAIASFLGKETPKPTSTVGPTYAEAPIPPEEAEFVNGLTNFLQGTRSAKHLGFEKSTVPVEVPKPSLKESLPPERVQALTRPGGRPRTKVRAEKLSDPEARVVASKQLIEEGISAEEAIKKVDSLEILEARALAEKQLTKFRVTTGETTTKGGRPAVLEKGDFRTGAREISGLQPEKLDVEVIEKGLRRSRVNLETLAQEPPSPVNTLNSLKTQASTKGFELNTEMGEKGITYKLTGPGGSQQEFMTLDEVSKVVGETPQATLQPIERKNFSLESPEPQPSPFEKAVTGKRLDEHDVALLRQQKEFYERTKNSLEGDISQPEAPTPAREPIQLTGRVNNITGITSKEELKQLIGDVRAAGYEPLVVKAPGGYDILYSRPGENLRRVSELYYKMITKGPRSLKPEEMKYLNKMYEEGGEVAGPFDQGSKPGMTRREFLKASGRAISEGQKFLKRAHLSKDFLTHEGIERVFLGEGVWADTPYQEVLAGKFARDLLGDRRASRASKLLDTLWKKVDALPKESPMQEDAIAKAAQVDDAVQALLGRRFMERYRPTNQEFETLLDDLVDTDLGEVQKYDYISDILGKLEDSWGVSWTPEGLIKLSSPNKYLQEGISLLKNFEVFGEKALEGVQKLGEQKLTRRQLLTLGLGKKKGEGSSPFGVKKQGQGTYTQSIQNRLDAFKPWYERVAQLAKETGQKGLEKIPKEWVETVRQVTINPQEGGGRYTYPFDLRLKLQSGQFVEDLHPGGQVTIGQAAPDALVHEIAHSGWYGNVPLAEKTVFWREYLRNPKQWLESYGGPLYSESTGPKGRNFIEKNRVDVQRHASEIFAMAVAEKATRSTRGSLYGHLGMSKGKDVVYGKLSKEARAIIDKYVKTILLAIGGVYAQSSRDIPTAKN